jgi:hypothetical protein
MSKFLEKYDVVENVRSSVRNNVVMTPEERNRQKLIQSIDLQLKVIDSLIDNNQVPDVEEGSKSPRLFWQEVLGGYLFTPRFGNDFLFGKNRGVHCASYQELRVLITDFRAAVTNGEFDDSISEISSSRKGRGVGVSRNKS